MPHAHDHPPSLAPHPHDHALVIQATRLLARLRPEGSVVFPVIGDLGAAFVEAHARVNAGSLDDRASWLIQEPDAEAGAPEGWAWHETRAVLAALTASQCQAVNCARQLDWWSSRHRFCGCCGTPTVDAPEERARICPSCGARFYPAAAPAVIVAVTWGERLLLAHNANFRPGLFSLLAGFVDPGENLEQTAVREVHEETGITIGDLRYVTSQPWPFPNSLMVGFRASRISGDIQVDGREIERAGWFTRDNLPDIPSRGTVARELIDGWLRETSA